jgi:hypothetical protein
MAIYSIIIVIDVLILDVELSIILMVSNVKNVK